MLFFFSLSLSRPFDQEFRKLSANVEKRNAHAGFLFIEAMLEDAIARDGNRDWHCLIDLWCRLNHAAAAVASNTINVNSNIQLLYQKLSNLPDKNEEFDRVNAIMLFMLSVTSCHGAWSTDLIRETECNRMLSQYLQTRKPSTPMVIHISPA